MVEKQQNRKECVPSLFRKLTLGWALAGVLAMMGLAGPAVAQLNETGTITGRVTDASGAVVDKASVTITNVDTKVATQLTSNRAGEYSEAGLNVGHYTVTVTGPGFDTYRKENFYLEPSSVYRVDAELKPGSKDEVVDVQADSVHVETQTNEISTEISGTEADMLALNGRNYQDLATLMPGVTNLAAGTPLVTGGYTFQNVISVNGMGRTSVFYTLDGIWNQELGDLLTNTVTPDPEAIDQIKLLQNNYSVQYNMLGGAVMMVHTKEGTSQFHGQAWYFYRSDKFNALNWFVQPGLNPTFNWNVGGIGFGGPVYIPHLYEHKDKTFYYVNFQYVNELLDQAGAGTNPGRDQRHLSPAGAKPENRRRLSKPARWPQRHGVGHSTIGHCAASAGASPRLRASCPIHHFVSSHYRQRSALQLHRRRLHRQRHNQRRCCLPFRRQLCQLESRVAQAARHHGAHRPPDQ